MIEVDTAAILVTLKEPAALRTTIDSLREEVDGVIVVVRNDPSATTTQWHDGVLEVGTGMNLGWAAGMHAGLRAVGCEYVWAIQDDLVMLPGAYAQLRAALDGDAGLGSVRPLPLAESGQVLAGQLGARVDDLGMFSDPLPAVATAPEALAALRGSYLPSSGQLIRRRAWDEVGGFDPWFYPWGYIDVDFGRALREAGWRFTHVSGAGMRHTGGGSSSLLFRQLLTRRNRELFAAKWGGAATTAVGEGVVARVRDRDRAGSLPEIVAVAAADCVAYLAHCLAEVGSQIDDLSAQVAEAEASVVQMRFERDVAQQHVADAEYMLEAARRDQLFVADQFRAAAAQRDQANEQIAQLTRSRAWAVVDRYWRLKQRVRRGPG